MSGKGLDAVEAEKTFKPIPSKMLKTMIELQSFQRGISYFGQRCEKIMVFTPLQFPFLAKSRNTGAQTIPFKDDRL